MRHGGCSPLFGDQVTQAYRNVPYRNVFPKLKTMGTKVQQFQAIFNWKRVNSMQAVPSLSVVFLVRGVDEKSYMGYPCLSDMNIFICSPLVKCFE